MNQNKDGKILSAYEKAAQERIDPRCIPQKLDGPVPEHDENQILLPKVNNPNCSQHNT